LRKPKKGNPSQSRALKALITPDLNIRSVGRQGWEQLLTWKKEILDAFDRGRRYARGHEVETYHGLVAEAHFRNWLGEFLPKRFGVTAGYIISQGVPAEVRAPAFDVIIYDQLNSPVLWAESHPDRSPQGKLRAIPAEHVKAVVEVKAALNAKSARHVVEHLCDLRPILSLDVAGATFPCFLPREFTCWTVFFDLRQKDEKSVAALNHLAQAIALRGFSGGLVLRGEGLGIEMTGEIGTSRCSEKLTSLPSAATLLEGTCFSEYQEVHKPTLSGLPFGQVQLSWSRVYFTTWPFNLLRSLGAELDARSVPSWYGFPPVGTVE
jgi:hypothetical protein